MDMFFLLGEVLLSSLLLNICEPQVMGFYPKSLDDCRVCLFTSMFYTDEYSDSTPPSSV